MKNIFLVLTIALTVLFIIMLKFFLPITDEMGLILFIVVPGTILLTTKWYFEERKKEKIGKK